MRIDYVFPVYTFERQQNGTYSLTGLGVRTLKVLGSPAVSTCRSRNGPALPLESKVVAMADVATAMREGLLALGV